MGVHRVTTKAAKAYAARERILGAGISVLGDAGEKAATLDKKVAEECGNLAAELIPHAPGYAGKLMLVAARLFWALAGVEEKEAEVLSLEELEKKIESIKKALE